MVHLRARRSLVFLDAQNMGPLRVCSSLMFSQPIRADSLRRAECSGRTGLPYRSARRNEGRTDEAAASDKCERIYPPTTAATARADAGEIEPTARQQIQTHPCTHGWMPAADSRAWSLRPNRLRKPKLSDKRGQRRRLTSSERHIAPSHSTSPYRQRCLFIVAMTLLRCVCDLLCCHMFFITFVLLLPAFS